MTTAIAAAAAFVISLLMTPAVAGVAVSLGAVDRPGAKERKAHRAVTPLFGGIAVYAAFASVAAVAIGLGAVPAGIMPIRSLYGILAGGLVLMIGGYLDDRYDLPPSRQLIFTALAAAVAVGFGIGIESVRSPFGGYVLLDRATLDLAAVGIPWTLRLPGDIIAFLWILGLTYTTKVLDGLDGLVAGLTVISSALIIGVALRPELDQPDVAFVAAIVAGAFLGFLVWNMHPARVFLGEAGSTFAGFAVACLAIVSGSKVATTMLVLGVPLVDLAIVIAGRLREGSRVTGGDRRHLHYRLIAAGLSERNAVLVMYAFALAFGSIGLIAGTAAKAVAFLTLAAALTVGGRYLRERR